jgi:thioester reductase-like protein
VGNSRDLLGALITESLRLRRAPDIDGWYTEMTPVDYVGNAICALATDADITDRVFHLGDPRPLRARTLFEQFADLGYDLQHVPWGDWVAGWQASRADGTDDPVHVLRAGMPSPDDLRAVTVLDDRATRPRLQRRGVRRPRIDADLLATYSRHFHAQGWLDRPPRRASAGAS